MPRLPEFKTDEEAAEFFDTHTVADFWDEMEPVEEITINLPRPPKRLVTLQFYPRLLDEIKRIASERGVPYQLLIQRWLGEKLDALRGASG